MGKKIKSYLKVDWHKFFNLFRLVLIGKVVGLSRFLVDHALLIQENTKQALFKLIQNGLYKKNKKHYLSCFKIVPLAIFAHSVCYNWKIIHLVQNKQHFEKIMYVMLNKEHVGYLAPIIYWFSQFYSEKTRC